ncbi:hypothetical protein TWF103_010118 [Orbilia oligospora]|nr:hypothetical protein TWF103_010118 [Orbilia oligospora]
MLSCSDNHVSNGANQRRQRPALHSISQDKAQSRRGSRAQGVWVFDQPIKNLRSPRALLPSYGKSVFHATRGESLHGSSGNLSPGVYINSCIEMYRYPNQISGLPARQNAYHASAPHESVRMGSGLTHTSACMQPS